MPLPPSMPTFGWLLCPPIKRWPSKAKGPPILLFFSPMNIPPQTKGNRPPHTFRPGLASSPMHPLMLTPSSIWLLFILIKQQPPKAKAPLLSLLFDASYFASPSEQTNNSERNPNSSRPVHGVGEQWRHDLVAPLLYPWSERGKSHWRVGWHGSSCWLLCLCELCFVFCAPTNNQTTVPFFSGRIFFQFCNNWCSYFDTTDSYLRFISTVGQTTVPFFFWVIIFSGCNLNLPKNMAGQTTVPFFLVVIFSDCM